MDREVVKRRDSGVVVWLTGLSGAGKSTLARAVAPRLEARARRVEILDGDVVRQQLSQGLGFSREDRDVNVKRIAFVANLLARNGVIVLVAAISPFRDARAKAREMTECFVEVHVAPPLEVCVTRDVKGLYAGAVSGVVPDFTGISQSYEVPLAPELALDTSQLGIDDCVAVILSKLEALGHLEPSAHDGELAPRASSPLLPAGNSGARAPLNEPSRRIAEG